VLEGLFRLGEFDCRGVPTVWKSYRGAGLDPATAQNLRAPLQVIRHNADAGAVVIHALLASLLEFYVGQSRIKQRVVNHLSNIFVGVIHRILLASALSRLLVDNLVLLDS